jgi:tRNA(Ile)-lysidine synthase
LPDGHRLELVEECDTNGNDVCRIDVDDVALPLYVRTRKYGDKMYLKKINGGKKVKDIFIDCKVSISDRDKWPVVVDSKDKIIWIPGLKKSKFTKLKNEKYDIIIKYS